MPTYYAVAEGRQRGIFDNWEDASKSVLGYPENKYKKFKLKEDAVEYLVQIEATRQSEIDSLRGISSVSQVGPSYEHSRSLDMRLAAAQSDYSSTNSARKTQISSNFAPEASELSAILKALQEDVKLGCTNRPMKINLANEHILQVLEEESPACVSKRWNYGSGEYIKQLQIFPHRTAASPSKFPPTSHNLAAPDFVKILELVKERLEKVIFEINRTNPSKGVQYAVKSEGSSCENIVTRWENEEWLAKFMSEAVRM